MLFRPLALDTIVTAAPKTAIALADMKRRIHAGAFLVIAARRWEGERSSASRACPAARGAVIGAASALEVAARG